MSNIRKIVLSGFAAAALSLCVATALTFGAVSKSNAEPITFGFSGDVTFVIASLSGTFNTTQSLSGSYTFEATTPDGDVADPDLGVYQLALTSLDLAINGYNATEGASPLGGIAVTNSAAADNYSVFGQPISGPDVNFFSPTSFSIFMADSTASAFDNDSLPLTPPNLADFDVSARWKLEFGFDGPFVEGDLTSLTLVPEPATLSIIATGLAGVGFVAWRRRKRKTA